MTIRFLADESCDFAVVRVLRAAGFDVLCISERAPRAEDTEVIDFALHEERIVLTEDKDFGRLVYSHGQQTLGGDFPPNSDLCPQADFKRCCQFSEAARRKNSRVLHYCPTWSNPYQPHTLRSIWRDAK